MKLLIWHKDNLLDKSNSTAYGNDYNIPKYYSWRSLPQHWPILILRIFNKVIILLK